MKLGDTFDKFLALYRNKEELVRIPYVEKRFYYDYYMRKLKKKEESKKRRLKRAKRKLLKAMNAFASEIKSTTKYADIEHRITEQTSKSNSVSLLSLDERVVMFQLFQSKLINGESIEDFIMEFKDKKKSAKKKKKDSVSKEQVEAVVKQSSMVMEGPQSTKDLKTEESRHLNGNSERSGNQGETKEKAMLGKNHEK